MAKWNVYITTQTVEEVTVEAESQSEALKMAESVEIKTPVKASKDFRVHRPEGDSAVPE